MTDTQQILTLIREQGKLIRKLARQSKSEQWLTAEQVKEEFGLSKKYLQLKRKQGQIKSFRCLTTGKNFQYKREEIEGLFTVIKN